VVLLPVANARRSGLTGNNYAEGFVIGGTGPPSTSGSTDSDAVPRRNVGRLLDSIGHAPAGQPTATRRRFSTCQNSRHPSSVAKPKHIENAAFLPMSEWKDEYLTHERLF
jgi:hypothetical protein